MNDRVVMLVLLLITCLLPAQSQNINLGAINFPRAYIHAGLEFPQGYYGVVLTYKDAVPVFSVYDSKQELLFEEMAVVKARSGGKMASSYRLQKELLKDEEYFLIKISKPGQWLMGFFLVKK